MFLQLFHHLSLWLFLGAYFYKNYTTADGHTFNYSVDFTGGIQTFLSFNKPVEGEKLVHILEKRMAWFCNP